MANIIGIVGSLRAGSVNGAVARAALAHTPDGSTLTMHDITDVPLYNGDIEDAGAPDSVVNLIDAVAAADAVVFFSPEYNGSFPAVVKNVIDWLSRPPRAWEGTALTMVTASPGPRAGLGVRSHFSAIMEHQPIEAFETLGIGAYGDKLDDNGELADEATLGELAAFLASFAAAVDGA